MGPFEILAPAGGFLQSYEEDGANMGRGANLYIKHELIDCIPVYHALYKAERHWPAPPAFLTKN